MNYLYKKISFVLLLMAVTLSSACKKDEALQEQERPLTDTIRHIQNLSADTIPNGLIDTTQKTAPADSMKTVVVLGSSTAAGFGASKPDSAWVNRLQSRLNTDKKNVKIINLAVGGYTTYQIMPKDFVTPGSRPAVDQGRNITQALSLHPSLIIINLPTNDIASNFTDDEIMSNYQAVVKLIKAQKLDYIITGTQPRNFSGADQRQRLRTLDDKMMATYTGHINSNLFKLSTSSYSILDMYSAGDGVHLNDKGHKVIYESFIRIFQYSNLLGYKVIKL